MLSSPLKTTYFHVLLALSDRDLHGYAIQRAVLDQTEGGMRLWPAMLYRSLGKLEEGGLIRQIEAPADEAEDERRHYYALTAEGRERLRVEGESMARWASAAAKISGA